MRRLGQVDEEQFKAFMASVSVQVTLADVNRVLDVGQLLASVLTPEELFDLRTLLDNEVPASQQEPDPGSTRLLS